MAMKIQNSVCEHPDKSFIIKRKDVEFLKAVDEYGGDADTTEIRLQTGMTKHQVNHRFGRLSDEGFITISRATESKNGGKPPKIATITEDGYEVIEIAQENGVVDYSANAREVVDDVSEVLEEITRRLDSFDDRLQNVEKTIDTAPAEAENLEDELVWLSEWTDVAETKITRMQTEIDEIKKEL